MNRGWFYGGAVCWLLAWPLQLYIVVVDKFPPAALWSYLVSIPLAASFVICYLITFCERRRKR